MMIQVRVCSSFEGLSGSGSAILLQAKARLDLVLKLQFRFRSISQTFSFSCTYQPPCHIHFTANHRGAGGKSNYMNIESLSLMSVHITLANTGNLMKSGPVMLACKPCPKVEGDRRMNPCWTRGQLSSPFMLHQGSNVPAEFSGDTLYVTWAKAESDVQPGIIPGKGE